MFKVSPSDARRRQAALSSHPHILFDDSSEASEELKSLLQLPSPLPPLRLGFLSIGKIRASNRASIKPSLDSTVTNRSEIKRLLSGLTRYEKSRNFHAERASPKFAKVTTVATTTAAAAAAVSRSSNRSENRAASTRLSDRAKCMVSCECCSVLSTYRRRIVIFIDRSSEQR